MTTKYPEYDIKSLGDIFKIPEDRIDDFLLDLKDWYKIGKPTHEMLTELANQSGIKAGIEPFMKWIDDGKQDRKIIIQATASIEVDDKELKS